eukprot:1158376-Pelagomonas_calceolata.AAC.15
MNEEDGDQMLDITDSLSGMAMQSPPPAAEGSRSPQVRDPLQFSPSPSAKSQHRESPDERDAILQACIASTLGILLSLGAPCPSNTFIITACAMELPHVNSNTRMFVSCPEAMRLCSMSSHC